MTKNNKNNNRTRMAGSIYKLSIKSVVLIALIWTTIQTPVLGQDSLYTKPSWWFGVAGGANFNFYNGSTQKLNDALTAPVPFHSGNSVGLYIAPLVEFHRPDSRWGVMFQAGYDSRRGKFKQVYSPCNCPRDLSTNLSYITFEPSIRFAPFKSNFYLYAGGRIAYNLTKSFTYKESPNPQYPDQIVPADVTADLSDVNKIIYSMQVGAGYDIPLSSQRHRTQYVFSPFVAFQPYFGQAPRTIETWTVATFRVGAALKLGRGHSTKTNTKPIVPAAVVIVTPTDVVVFNPEAQFFVNAPENIPVEHKVKETFPLRNYVFFDLGSTEIPSRYVLLDKEQVKIFKEDNLELFTPKNLSGRSERQMTVYYNILNILGDRMSKNPSTSITLVGSSEKGPEDARMMAESIKSYLVNTFSIKGARITTTGRDKPAIPSEQPGGTEELELLRQGDRRVSIESGSPSLIMEFQSGPDAPLKPVEIIAIQEAPLDSYISFNNEGSNEAYSSWSMDITDDKGKVQYYGPYTQEKVSIPGKSILGANPEGYYKITMKGETKSGKTIKKDTTIHMVLWTPPTSEEVMRFSVIYEINNSNTSPLYEKYLNDIVTPKIPIGGTVIIHGYTDIIGDATNNLRLSMARANDVKKIMQQALVNAGRGDVKFEVYGFGEDESLSQFKNRFPEERFYNRAVMIDILPKK